MNNLNLQVPFKTILFTFFSLGIIYALYSIYPILILLLLAVIFALSIEPLVKKISSLKYNKKSLIPRGFAVIIAFLLVLTVIVSAFLFVLPEIFQQLPKLLETAQKTLELYSQKYNFSLEIPDLSQYSERAISISLSIFSNLFSILTFLLLSIYISVDLEKIKKFFHKLMPEGHKSVYDKILHEFEIGIGLWVKGQLILMLLIGTMSTIILYILGNPYYLPLGILAGILEIVPIVGPLISTLFAVLISYSMNGQTAALITLGAFYGIQVLENNLIVPKVMEKVSGFSPILILLAFLVFTNFLGLVGAILAIPILMFANILVKHFVIKK